MTTIPSLLVFTNVGTPVPPTTPLILVAAAISGSQINLTWSDASGNETGFYLERKLGVNGNYARIATLAANSTSYQDAGLSDGSSYYYRVAAYNGVGTSPYSNEAYALTPLAAPTNLVATAISGSQINLIWNDRSKSETGFYLERKLGVNGNYAGIAVLAANSRSFQDTGLSDGGLYYYRIAAYNNLGTSVNSNEANALTPLATPSNLSVSPVTLIQLRITWTSNSTNESGFQIERKTGVAGVYIPVTMVPAHTTSFDDIGLDPATTYYYRVRAITPFTTSGDAAEQSSTTLATADYIVMKAADSGSGSLRDVLDTVSVTSPSNVTILLNLTPGSSITINSSLPTLKQGMTLVGNCDSSGPTISIKGGLANITGLSLGGNNVIYGLEVDGFSGPGITNSGKGIET